MEKGREGAHLVADTNLNCDDLQLHAGSFLGNSKLRTTMIEPLSYITPAHKEAPGLENVFLTRQEKRREEFKTCG